MAPATNYFKRRIKMEKCVHLEAQGFKDRDIAHVLRLSKAGLATLKHDPRYKALRVELATGIVSEFSKEVAIDRQFLREKLKEMVPVALQGLYEAAINRKNDRIRFEACKTILNREGSLAEVSKTQVQIEDSRTNITASDDAAADALAKAFKDSGGELPPNPLITDKIQ